MTAPGSNGLPRTARDAARHYLRLGIHTVPVKPHDKRPWDVERNRPRAGWERLRVTDADVDRLFAADGNIGVLLGAPSGGLVDVDLDCAEARRAASHLLPGTDMAGGRESAPDSHHFYVVDDPPAKASDKFLDPCAADRTGPVLLELRSTGGQTVVAPSVYGADPDKGRPAGERFVWRRHGAAARVPIGVLATAVRGVAAAALLGRYWPASGRHDAALALAGGLRRAGWLEEPAVKFVAAICAAAGDREAGNRVGCVRDTFARGADERSTGWPTLARLVGEAIVGRVTDWLGVAAGGASAVSAICARGWPEPIPLGAAPAVPDYPLEVLPAVLRVWAEAVATELQVPADLPAALGLGLVAAGIARKVAVSPRPGFTEPTNLYVMAMLPPGERKTQTFRRAIAPVQELQREAREAAGPAVAEAESEFRIAEKRVRHLEDKIAKADGGERDALRVELGAARDELATRAVPAPPLFYSEDDTPEALKLELVRQGGRMMVATTEAKCLENITLYADRPNFDVYLKGHAGDEISSGRIERGRDAVTDPALSCLLAPQPAVAQGLAENEVLRGRGFLARWLYQLPVSRVGSRRIGPPPVPDHVQSEYAELVRAAWTTEYASDGSGPPGATVLAFAPDAVRAFEALESWVEPQLAPGGALARMAGWGNKLNGACARLAAALHVAERLGRGEPWSGPVPREVVGRAVRLCREYYVPHAVAAFDLMGADATVAGARRVWAWVASGGLEEFSKRDAFNANRSGFDTVDDLRPCLDLLERHYLIRPRPTGDEPRGRGRPSSPVYDVNPKGGSWTEGGGPAPPPVLGEGPAHKSQKPHNSVPPDPDVDSAVSAICAEVKPAGRGTEGGTPGIAERGDAPAHKSQKPQKSASARSPDVLAEGHEDPAVAPGSRADGATPAHKSQKPQKPSHGGLDDISATCALSARGGGAAGPTHVATAAGVDAVVRAIRAGSRVGVDLETTGLSHARDRVRLVSLATPTGTFLIDLFGPTDPARALGPVFAALSAAEVVGHNLGFDLPFLMRLGFVPGRVLDTMLASQVLHAGDRAIGHALKELAHRHLGVALDKELQAADWSGPLGDAHLGYAARDAEVPLVLWEKLVPEVAGAELTGTVEAEAAALPAIAWAAQQGVGFDRAAWGAVAAEAEARADELRERLDELVPNAGNLFGVTNWNSPEAVTAAFAGLGLTLGSTDDDALAALDHPAAALLREYRAASKLSGTYGREWLRHVAPDGRVYATWKQIGAGASGRMSCKGPNLQQLPRDPRYRRCFVAPPGRVLVKADYSQIELRIAAKIAGDRRMLEAYRRGEDLHTTTARAVLGKTDVTKADRQLAKSLNFGLLYGMGAKALAAYAASNFGVPLTESEAARHRDAFFRTYPGLRAWHRSVPNGTVPTRTLAGRRRVGVGAFTEKLNTPTQGTGADGLKRALALLWERRGACPDAFPVLLVHDEIVVECDEARREDAAAWVRDAMRDGMAPLIDPVPVEVEVSAGRTWGG